MFENMQGALNELFTWSSALGLFIGVVGGMIIGALPGLSATMGIALLIPITYGMRPSAAILMLRFHFRHSDPYARHAVLRGDLP